ncbi:hypothetical protein [Curtobacterium sp. VKM Ac-1393]|uniref:hypothetical protein n=1 Tax=Curtobacterium sp. VKM Ac-1393 TaxID=2783814 RepID=UPI00188BF21B|nr:hypothetical protein [Curtobacterium sp. VKM Ac-1393]MBF4607283.1 hypothetical protein [Curtobacterium sp. VKM Ac-1393]
MTDDIAGEKDVGHVRVAFVVQHRCGEMVGAEPKQVLGRSSMVGKVRPPLVMEGRVYLAVDATDDDPDALTPEKLVRPAPMAPARHRIDPVRIHVDNRDLASDWLGIPKRPVDLAQTRRRRAVGPTSTTNRGASTIWSFTRHIVSLRAAISD